MLYLFPLIYSMLSRWRLQRPKKKKSDTSGSIFPTTPRQRSNPHPLEGFANEIPHSPGTENGKMPGVCPGGDVEVSI